MKWVSRFSRRTAIPFVACCLLAFVGVARAGDKAQLSGDWNFNLDQSDDAQQKVQQAQQSSQRGSGGGGYPGSGNYPAGGGYPGGGSYPGGGGMGRGGMGGGMGRSGMGNPGGGVSSQEWNLLAANPKYLKIIQGADQIVISDDSDYTHTLYPDGKKHQEKDANGRKISTKTAWQGDELIAETNMGSGKLTETYQVSSDGKQLIVVSRYENSSLSVPLSIRREYDLGNATR